MRIGLVCPYSFDAPGGVQAHVVDLADHLQEGGHFVRVIGPATQRAGELPEVIVPGGGAVPVPYNGSVARLGFGPGVRRRLHRFIEEGRFDVLHVHEPNAMSFSFEALRFAEGPIVATYHAASSGSRALQIARPILVPRLEKVRAGIAVSETARRWQVEQLGGDPVLIPNGVDTELFRRAYRPRERTDRPARIVFLGRYDEPRKGWPILLRALDLLSAPVEVVVIGDGTPTSHPAVSYVGRVSDEDKARILGEADIYVAPNTGGESFGIVLVEAMAAGCAVVASDLESFAAVSGPAGQLFRTGDAEDLARVLDRLLADEAARLRCVEAGLERSQLYDWDVVTKRIVDVYETVADGTTVTWRGGEK